MSLLFKLSIPEDMTAGNGIGFSFMLPFFSFSNLLSLSGVRGSATGVVCGVEGTEGCF